MKININKLQQIIKAQSGVLLPSITNTTMIRKPFIDSKGFVGKPKNINWLGQPITKQVNIPKEDANRINKVLPIINKLDTTFKDKGYTPQQSSGAIGNLFFESGLNPAVNQHGGGPGFGLGQWEKGNSRYLKLQELANSYNKPITDENVQMKYLTTELTSPERVYTENAWGGRGRREEFTKSKSVDDSASNFSRLFLRPGKPHLDKRIAYSNYIYDQLND